MSGYYSRGGGNTCEGKFQRKLTSRELLTFFRHIPRTIVLESLLNCVRNFYNLGYAYRMGIVC